MNSTCKKGQRTKSTASSDIQELNASNHKGISIILQ
jgi:hypothetical protein